MKKIYLTPFIVALAIIATAFLVSDAAERDVLSARDAMSTISPASHLGETQEIKRTVVLSETTLQEGATITVNGDTCSKQSCTKTFETGDEVTIKANPSSTLRFKRWTNAGSSDKCYFTSEKECTFTIDDAPHEENIEADWHHAQTTVHIQKKGDGSGTVVSENGKINCGSTCTGTYELPRILEFDDRPTKTITAKPASNSTFSHWSLDSEDCRKLKKGSSAKKLTDKQCVMEFAGTESKTEIAVFKKKQTSDSGGDSGSNTDSGGNTNNTTGTTTTNTAQNTTSNTNADDQGDQQEEEEKPPEPADVGTVTVNGEEIALGGEDSDGNDSGDDTDQDSRSDVSITENEQFTLSGKTVANGKVTLYIFSEPKQATTTADKNGQWSHAVSGMQPGDHRVETEVTHPDTGKTSDRKEVLSFTVTPVRAQTNRSPEPVTNETLPADMLWLGGGTAAAIILFGSAGAYWWWRRNGSRQHCKSFRITGKRDKGGYSDTPSAHATTPFTGSDSDAGSDGRGSD